MSRTQPKISQKIKNHENVKKQPSNTNPKIDQTPDTRNYQKESEAAITTIPPIDKGNSYKISRKTEAIRREMNVTQKN